MPDAVDDGIFWDKGADDGKKAVANVAHDPVVKLNFHQAGDGSYGDDDDDDVVAVANDDNIASTYLI